MDYYPKFYYSSDCLAGDCPDTCCAGWEIPLTEKDTDFLKKRFDKPIFDNIVTKDSYGDACMRLKNGRCPFLNTEGLCSLRLMFSQSETPEVCRQHPLFIEEYDGFTEKCPSLSCPAVCREIFSSDLSDEIYPMPEYRGDDVFLSVLIKSRKMILKKINTGGIDLFEAIAGTIYLATDIEQTVFFDEKIETFDFERSESFFGYACLPYDIFKYVGEYITMLKDRCEILEEKWRQMLEKTSKSHFDLSNLRTDSRGKEYLQFYMYLVYRYWLKGINTDSVLEYALFIVFGTIACSFISLSSDVPFAETARMFSKEIEHDSDNIEAALEFIDKYLAEDER